MAARAKVARARRPHAVLAQPVSIVNQVADGRRVFRREVFVATIAGAEGPLILVLVAAKTGGHLGPERVRMLLRDGLVAADAIAVGDGLVRTMLEAQMLPRELRPFAHVRGAVAAETRVVVVGFLVAAAARCVRGQVERLDVPGRGDPLVAVHAVDAVGRVRAMLERMGLVVTAEPEHAGASCQQQRREDDEREGNLHNKSQRRDARTRAFAS